MLEFDRKQLASIGEVQLRDNLAAFLNRHLGGNEPVRLDELDAHLDQLIAHCRKSGLKSQRAVAAYALACALFGSDRVGNDPSIAGILADRSSPQLDRALLIEIWTAGAYGDYKRSKVA